MMTPCCERQVLQTRVPVVGAPFELEYESDCVPGRAAERRLQIEIDAGSHPDLDHVVVETQIAGRRFAEMLPPLASQTYELVWDGYDAMYSLGIRRRCIKATRSAVHRGIPWQSAIRDGRHETCA